MFWFTKTFLIASLFVFAYSHGDTPHTCIHDQLEFEPEFIDEPVSEEVDGRVLQQSYQNIRINFDFTPAIQTITNTTYLDYIRNIIIPAVENFWEATLSVIPISGNLTGQNQATMCAGAITVPPIYNTTGVAADLVLFVTSVNDSSQSYVAFAGPCLMSSKNYRPLFGRIVFNLAKIKPTATSAVQVERDISVSLHETTHALGFTSGLYSMYINPSTGLKLTNHTFTQIVNGQNITVLNVEPLTTRLRNYFGCQSLTGLYLENEGGSGSQGSHMERRILYNEYMTASTIQDSRVSQFSLALLEGTGWYQANYSMAEPMTYGQGKGCDFLNTPCISKTTNQPAFDEFCSPLTTVGCSWTGRGAGSCGASTIRTSSALSSAVDYWNNKTVVNDAFSDNCPTFSIYSNIDCEDSTLQTTATLPAYEFYGMGGKCFVGNLYTPGATISATGYCFKPTCQLQSNGSYTLKVGVGANTVSCYAAGPVAITGLTGKLTCPDPDTFCTELNAEGYCRRGCTARGTCVNQACQCMDGWTNYDCSRMTYTDNCAKCSGLDPLRTSCYGDVCACNPSNSTCMCALGLQTSGCPTTTTTTTTPTPTTTNTSTTTNTTAQPTSTTNTSTSTNTTTTPTTTTNTSTATNTTQPMSTTNTSTATNTTTQPTTTTTPTTTATNTSTATNTTTQPTATTTTTTTVKNTTTTNGTSTTLTTTTTTVTTTKYSNGTTTTLTTVTTKNTTTTTVSQPTSGTRTNISADGANEDSTGSDQTSDKKSNGISKGLLIGGVIGIVVVVFAGIFLTVKYVRRLRAKGATTAPIKKQPSFANPTLQRQMTANQQKYAVVP